jgi:hypothetical protein
MRISDRDFTLDRVPDPENAVVLCGYAVTVFLRGARGGKLDVLVHEVFDRAVDSICSTTMSPAYSDPSAQCTMTPESAWSTLVTFLEVWILVLSGM